MSKLNVEAWKSRKTHDVTLPSGAEVKIQLPNLPQLAKTGRIPNPLIQVALNGIGNGRDTTEDDILKLNEWHAFLVSITVIEPKVTPEDVADLPVEDQEMLIEFATRIRDMDALYHHIGGLEKVDSFREARSL